VEPELALSSGNKPKRMHCTKDQMTTDALGKIVELFVKVGCTPFQKLLMFTKVIPEEEEEVAMGMDYRNELDYRKRENLHEEELLYEDGPFELEVKTTHITSSVASNTTPPQMEREKEKGGDEEKEAVAMDEVDEKEQKEGKVRSERSHLQHLTPKRGGTSKCSPQKLYNEKRCKEERQRKWDLVELERGQKGLKLEREEMAKMAQTLKESTFKDSLVMCMGEIIATMQKMTMTQDKVNKNLVKKITGIVRSLPKKPCREATEAPKAIKTLMLEPFSGKEGKFKRVREWFLLKFTSKRKPSPWIVKKLEWPSPSFGIMP
jgi:hypothetical protein